MVFGKKIQSLAEVTLNGRGIEWVNTWKYLGVSLVSGKEFGCSVDERIRKFYKCANAILRIEGRSHELIMLQLLESHCVPLITYAIEVSHIADRRELSKLRAAYNSIFRKLFDYRNWQSVRELQKFLSRPNWEELVQKRTNTFMCKLSQLPQDSLVHCF